MCSMEKLLWKNLQNSQENTFALFNQILKRSMFPSIA